MSTSHGLSHAPLGATHVASDAPLRSGHPPLASALFAVGDAALLVAVATSGTWVMHLAHETGIGFLLAALLGMSVAMLVQVMLAVIVSPLLGSIESMVPSAVVGMTVPALVCVVALLGVGWHRPTLLAAAALLAVAFSLWLKLYARRCRRRFARLSSGRAGAATSPRRTP